MASNNPPKGHTPNALDDYQSKLQAWMFWNRQSSEFKMNHPEPPKPTTETKDK